MHSAALSLYLLQVFSHRTLWYLRFSFIGVVLEASACPKNYGNSTNGSELSVGVNEGQIVWGPWRIPGVLGIANNAFSCAYLLFILFFSFWPSSAHVTPQSMNWSILVTGFVAILSTLYYLFRAKNTYAGPIIEVTEQRQIHYTA